jgi:hypothetical protein
METAQPSTAGTSEQAALLGYLGWTIDQFSRSVNSLGNNQSLATPLMVANRRKGRPEPGWQYWHRAAPPPGYPDTGLGTLFDRNWHSPWDYTPFDLHGSFICKHSDSSPILKPDLKRAHELQRTRHLAGSGTSSAADAGSEDSFRRLDPGTHNTLFRSGQHTQNPLGQVFDRGIMPNIRDLSPTSGGRPQVAPTGHIDVLLSIRPCNRRSPLQGILGADGAGAAVPGALVSTPGTAVIPSVPNSHKKYRGCFAHNNKARPVLPGYF